MAARGGTPNGHLKCHIFSALQSPVGLDQPPLLSRMAPRFGPFGAPPPFIFLLVRSARPLGSPRFERGDFVAFVGDWGVHSLLDKSSEEFRRVCRFPSQSISLPSSLSFIADSDDGAFRENGFGAIRVTDTGSWRSPSVGTAADNLRTLDCTRMGRLAHGLAQTVTGLAKKTLSLL